VHPILVRQWKKTRLEGVASGDGRDSTVTGGLKPRMASNARRGLPEPDPTRPADAEISAI
jgi:hypothetical protein